MLLASAPRSAPAQPDDFGGHDHDAPHGVTASSQPENSARDTPAERAPTSPPPEAATQQTASERPLSSAQPSIAGQPRTGDPPQKPDGLSAQDAVAIEVQPQLGGSNEVVRARLFERLSALAIEEGLRPQADATSTLHVTIRWESPESANYVIALAVAQAGGERIVRGQFTCHSCGPSDLLDRVAAQVRPLMQEFRVPKEPLPPPTETVPPPPPETSSASTPPPTRRVPPPLAPAQPEDHRVRPSGLETGLFVGGSVTAATGIALLIAGPAFYASAERDAANATTDGQCPDRASSATDADCFLDRAQQFRRTALITGAVVTAVGAIALIWGGARFAKRRKLARIGAGARLGRVGVSGTVSVRF